MAVEFAICPICKQKLAVQSYTTVGSIVVCANPHCDTRLRIVKRKPLKVELVPVEETLNANSSPESYG